jgi:hypothetical protein
LANVHHYFSQLAIEEIDGPTKRHFILHFFPPFSPLFVPNSAEMSVGLGRATIWKIVHILTYSDSSFVEHQRKFQTSTFISPDIIAAAETFRLTQFPYTTMPQVKQD